MHYFLCKTDRFCTVVFDLYDTTRTACDSFGQILAFVNPAIEQATFLKVGQI